MTIASMGNFIGIGSGFIISAYISDIYYITLYQAIVSLLLLPITPLLKGPNEIEGYEVDIKGEIK